MLLSDTIPADAEPGMLVGVVAGKTPGSTLATIPSDDRFALSGDDTVGWSLVVGLTTAAEGEALVTLRETHPQADGPSDNLLAITITPATGGGVLLTAFTFNSQPFTVSNQPFTYGAPA